MAGELILIVEDDIGIRELIQLYLLKNEYRVLVAENGEEALTIMETEQPELIVLDIEMPRMNGFELCKHVRKKFTLPIIFLSSRKGVPDKLKCFELGGDDYITKPFDFSELKARIEVNIRKYRQNGLDLDKTSDIIKHRELELKRSSCRFTLNGELLELSVKETQLLILLVKHPEQVWSAEQLYDHIWGLESTGNVETVKVHISNLRRKLELDPSQPKYIKTVRGFGYLFAK